MCLPSLSRYEGSFRAQRDDQSAFAEQFGRAARRAQRDAVLFGEPALGGKWLVGRQLSGFDPDLDVVGHPFIYVARSIAGLESGNRHRKEVRTVLSCANYMGALERARGLSVLPEIASHYWVDVPHIFLSGGRRRVLIKDLPPNGRQ